MRIKRTAMLGSFVAALALALGALARAGDDRPTELAKGKLAPAWSVADWKNAGDKKALTLDDLAGKVVVIDFFGVW